MDLDVERDSSEGEGGRSDLEIERDTGQEGLTPRWGEGQENTRTCVHKRIDRSDPLEPNFSDDPPHTISGESASVREPSLAESLRGAFDYDPELAIDLDSRPGIVEGDLNLLKIIRLFEHINKGVTADILLQSGKINLRTASELGNDFQNSNPEIIGISLGGELNEGLTIVGSGIKHTHCQTATEFVINAFGQGRRYIDEVIWLQFCVNCHVILHKGFRHAIQRFALIEQGEI